MRVKEECLDCLKGLAERALSLVEAPPQIKERTRALVHKFLKENFSPDFIPFQLSARLQEIIKEHTNSPDPFYQVKRKEMGLARRLFQELFPLYSNNLYQLIALSALGNVLDFFKGEEEVIREIKSGISFFIDQRSEFISLLRRGDRILFLADNAGEVFFDAPLVHKLEEIAEVVYVVKGGPIQNDITLNELEESGIRFCRVITTGLASPGIELERCSKEFLSELESSDLIVAKGMGYYEALSELNIGKRVLFLLKAKCNPVASSLSVPLGSYVSKLSF